MKKLLIGLTAFVLLSYAVLGFALTDFDITVNLIKKVTDNKIVLKDLSVTNGVVTVAGVMETQTAADALVQMLESEPGVRDVNTASLTLSGGEVLAADNVISAKVRGTFIREQIFGPTQRIALPVQVKTTMGIVYLTGTVANQNQRIYIIRLSLPIPGVQRVISTVQVRSVEVLMPN